jgi:DNA primase
MSKVDKLYQIFSSVLGENKQFSNGEYYFYCPFCQHHKPKLAVNLVKGKWHCWKCNASGNRLLSLARRLNFDQREILQLRELLADDIPYVVKHKEEEVELRLPYEFQSLVKPTSSIKYKHAMVYLKNRGLTAYDIIKYNIGYCETGKFADRIIIPSYDKDYKLNYFTARSFFEGMQNYLYPPVRKDVIMFENTINWNYPITLVEGAFDAIAVKRNAIPLSGKILMKRLKDAILEKRPPAVYIALDNDALSSALKIAQSFVNEGLVTYMIELPQKDPSELGFEKFVNLYKSAEPITYSKIVELKMKE